LAEKGLIEGEWKELESRRRAKVYALTASGRKQLNQEKLNWKKVATAVAQVLTEEG
jgi:DNA-binding PadR family transcriptional regulator